MGGRLGSEFLKRPIDETRDRTSIRSDLGPTNQSMAIARDHSCADRGLERSPKPNSLRRL